jgi:hypothetical protein
MASATSGIASVAAVTMTIAVITPAAYPAGPFARRDHSLCERAQEVLDTLVRRPGWFWERSHGVAAVTPIRSQWP